jgi:hypothetical protein
MKREREAVWVDDEEEVINEKMNEKKVYGRRKADTPHTSHLRSSFQYVVDIISSYLSQVRVRQAKMGGEEGG